MSFQTIFVSPKSSFRLIENDRRCWQKFFACVIANDRKELCFYLIAKHTGKDFKDFGQ